MSDDSSDSKAGQGETGRPEGMLSRFEAGRGTSGVHPASGAGRGHGDAVHATDDEILARSARVRVDVDGGHRPFMLGILVHSLTEAGLSFDDAYSASQEIWSQVSDRKFVTRAELREMVQQMTGHGRRESPSNDPNPSLGGPLWVVGKTGRWPFNHGRLQTSFLAAGLQPAQAFETVADIEWELRGLGDSTVTRDAIRGLANDTLLERFGSGVAERYRTWRHYQNDDDRPVIVLLGGTSGVGKSSLALEVARRLSIGRLLSTDSIRDVMRVMVSDELVPTLHVSSFEAHTRVVGGAASLEEDAVIAGFLEQTRTVSVGVRAVIERAIIEGTSLVLDGVSLVPGLLEPEVWKDRAHVFFLLAADVDRESLHGHLMARAEGPGTRRSERYVRNFQEIFRIQEDLLARAQAADIPIVDVQDLESAIVMVVKLVVGELGDKRALEREAK